MNITIVVLWTIFALLFLGLGLYQWRQSKQSVHHIPLTQRPETHGLQMSAKYKGMDIDQPIKDFVRGFNLYIDGFNKQMRREHLSEAIGFWVASATALLSLILELWKF